MKTLLVALALLAGCGGRLVDPHQEGAYLETEYGPVCSDGKDADGHHIYEFCVVEQGVKWAATFSCAPDCLRITCRFPYGELDCTQN